MKYFIKNSIYVLFAFSAVFIVFSCKERAKDTPVKVSNEASATSGSYQMVEIPSLITDNNLRAQFMLIHFWDNLNLKDTSFVANPIYIREPFREYLNVLSVSDFNRAKESIINLTKRVMVSPLNVVKYFLNIFEESLYDPSSIYKNEELYISIAEEAIKTKNLPFEIKELLSFQLVMLKKNRVNTKASNINFVTRDANSSSLYMVKSPFILLLFYEPDCQNCNISIEMMKTSNILKAAQNKIKIVAIYTGGDGALWSSHLKNMSKEWIVGFDSESSVVNNSIYDRRAAPSFYILDSNKIVLLKDATYDTAIEYIKENIK